MGVVQNKVVRHGHFSTRGLHTRAWRRLAARGRRATAAVRARALTAAQLAFVVGGAVSVTEGAREIAAPAGWIVGGALAIFTGWNVLDDGEPSA